MTTITNPMTTAIPVANGTAITVTTSLDTSTGTYTTTASYPALNINYVGTPQDVVNQLNDLVNKDVVTDETTAYAIDTAVHTIFKQQSDVGSLENTPNVDPATPPVNTDTTTAQTTGNISVTTTTTTGGGSTVRKQNSDGTITTTVTPGQNSTVTTTTTDQANPQLGPQPTPAINTPNQTVTPGIQTTQNNVPTISGSGDDDSTPKNNPAQGQQAPQNVNTTNANPATGAANATSPDSSSAGPQPPSAGSSTSNDANNPGGRPGDTGSTGGGPAAPGARLSNPLSVLASYNYIISLYVCTPSAYDAWVKAGRTDITAFATAQPGQPNKGVYLICQSGGINNSTVPRATGFELDYYIDNVKFTTLISPKETGGDTYTQDLTFEIIEPYGFSFITNLTNAVNAIYADPTTPALGDSNKDKPESPLRGLFILGIKFLGWNLDGTVATGQEKFGNGVLDANGTPNGLFQQYYDFRINDLSFKLDGRPVTYNIAGTVLSAGEAMGTKRGTLETKIDIQGGTVDDALQSVIKQLNDIDKNLVANKSAKLANTYKIEYLGDANTDIKKALIVSPSQLDKSRLPNANIKKPSDINDATAQKALPNYTQRTISIAAGQNIAAATSQIIAQSEYILKALKVVQDSSVDPNSNGSQPATTNPNPLKIAWYNINPRLEHPQWDSIRGDWVYVITYVIQKYETPAVQAPTAGTNNTSDYPGAYKLYNYWFTGQNTEVLSLSFQFNNLYFQSVAGLPPGQTSSASKGNNAPVAPAKRTGQNPQGGIGTNMESPNSYRSFLGDPGAYNEVKLNMIGDPDWLVVVTPPISTVYNKYYGSDGRTINPGSGQVFVEVNLVEAIDYNNTTGLLDLNNSIYFGELPKDVAAKVKGIPFWVQQVNSEFRNGKFTQTLELNGATWPITNAANTADNNRNSDPSSSASQSGPTKGNSSSSPNNGLKDPPNIVAAQAKNSAAYDAQIKAEYAASKAQKAAPTGPQSQPVQDDDSSPGAGTYG